MNTTDVAAAVTGIAVVAMAFYYIPRLWRGSSGEAISRVTQLWGDRELAAALLRASPVATVVAFVMVAVYFFDRLSPVETEAAWATALRYGLLAVLVVAIGLMVAVILWNKPRRFVPPAFRGTPGLLGPGDRGVDE